MESSSIKLSNLRQTAFVFASLCVAAAIAVAAPVLARSPAAVADTPVSIVR
jgi:hypothetical protein